MFWILRGVTGVIFEGNNFLGGGLGEDDIEYESRWVISVGVLRVRPSSGFGL